MWATIYGVFLVKQNLFTFLSPTEFKHNCKLTQNNLLLIKHRRLIKKEIKTDERESPQEA